ncbi:MAG: M48 family metallopeptidase [Proteobacteria bacterium]|nr:M48 family metallopeptidase [Pseudomonadota bacterium]
MAWDWTGSAPDSVISESNGSAARPAPQRSSTPLRAQWFDGRRSRARPVLIRLRADAGGPRLQLRALDDTKDALDLAHGSVDWPERFGARLPPKVMVDLRQHGSLQVDDAAAWAEALAAAGHNQGLAERMLTRWRLLLAVAALAGAGLWSFYHWGTPWAARELTRFVPLSWEQRIADHALRQLDAHYLQPSRLPLGRQARLRAGFARLAAAQGPGLQPYAGYAPALTLALRSGMPANAFALPGGTIVLLDDLVEKADRTPGAGEDAVLGVLAHEIGHVRYRHTTRLVVEQGVLQTGLGLALGDVSGVVSTGASLLTGLSYQRRHEEQADCYATRLLAQQGLPTAPLARLLVAMDPRAGDTPQVNASAAPGTKHAERSRNAMDWLNTHPSTAGRADRIRVGAVGTCGD